MRLHVNSTEFVNVPIDSAEGLTLTDDPIWLAFPVADVPVVDADWKDAAWASLGGQLVARLLIGPVGDLTLGVGWYDVWARLTDSTERPWMYSGQLQVYTT